jgi:Ca-activated chloride channel family protein
MRRPILVCLSTILTATLVLGCRSSGHDADEPGDAAGAGGAGDTAGSAGAVGTGGSEASGAGGQAAGSGNTGASGGPSGGGAAAGSGNATPTDDWAFDPSLDSGAAGSSASYASAPSGASDEGFAVGGSKDANAFRQNIDNGYLPFETNITYEGIFYGYYFDRGQTEPCTELFCPTYSQMRSSDILSDSEELYLSVGLSSGLSEADMQRKKLNLVVVLDISGSMGSPFSGYYYDQYGNPVEDTSVSTQTKIEIADQAVVDMLGHLKRGDRFGMVLFDENAYLGKPLSAVETTDMDAIKRHILEIRETGSTNLEAGYTEGTGLFEPVADADPDEYENRIILLTDAMPNTGDTSEGSLLGMVDRNAAERIHTTFIGIGVDFNTTLIDAITKVRGANYYSVHNEDEFKSRMDDEFEYMVTPLVFDLELTFRSEGYAIDAVYGSPEADQATGVLMRVNTLFPAKSEGGQTKGGIILLKLRRTGDSPDIELAASYENRSGEAFVTRESLAFDAELDVAPNTGIQKAVLLSRYVTLMKEWIAFERQAIETDPGLSEWEQTSTPLVVSDEYKATMQTFLTAFEAEAEDIGDSTLDQEAALLEKLIGWEGAAE